ncbi:MAG: hypothetical protein MUP81_00680 [Dehalococcoidia bacterium]|nr:hypothetical protein [Dehalococcoidia bacterium]
MADYWNIDTTTGTTPPTPYWLPWFSPGQVENQPLQFLPVKLPGGKLWSQTPWSQKAGLESYINWGAGRVPGMIAAYQDMVDRMYMMFPKKSPSRATYWATPTQGW